MYSKRRGQLTKILESVSISITFIANHFNESSQITLVIYHKSL